MVTINTDECLVCGGCIDLCPKTAILMVDDKVMIDTKNVVSARLSRLVPG